MKSTWLGLTEYSLAMQTQDLLWDRCGALINLMVTASHGASRAEALVGLEHPLTITLGRRADALRDILAPVRTLKEKNVTVIGTERGGQATLHNPGQLVIYPIINLRSRQLRLRDYVYLLEDVTRRFLLDFGIQSYFRGDEPGLHTDKGKIAFFGIRVKNGITSHGLSINVTNNLEDFTMIRSCGQATEAFSKMSDYGANTDLETLFRLWSNYFHTGLGLTQDVNRPMLNARVVL